MERDISAIRDQRVDIPLAVNEMGHYALSVVASRKGPSRVGREPNLTPSYFEWTFSWKRPDLSTGGLHFPITSGGLLRSVPPTLFSACSAVTLGDACDGSVSDPRKIIAKLRVNRGHASACQPKTALVDSGGGNSRLVNFAGEVLEHCETRRALEKAPHAPIAGTPTVSTFNEKVQVDLLFLGDLIASQVLVDSKYLLILPVQPGNPQGLWDVFCDGRSGICGAPKTIQFPTDPCGESRIKLHF